MLLGASAAVPRTARGQDRSPPFTAEQAASGEDIYRDVCATCHGADLDGTLAPPLVGKPFLANWFAGDRTLGDLYEQISENMPMTAPGSLSKEQYEALTAFLLARNGVEANGEPLEGDAQALAAFPLSPPDGEDGPEPGMHHRRHHGSGHRPEGR